jgi:Mn-dependent DtxR family transcriptional regulator
MKQKLSPIEAKILTVLIKKDDYMNTTEIAREVKISWNTAFNYLNKFEEKGGVEKMGEGTVYWRAILQD